MIAWLELMTRLFRGLANQGNPSSPRTYQRVNFPAHRRFHGLFRDKSESTSSSSLSAIVARRLLSNPPGTFGWSPFFKVGTVDRPEWSI
jgi:hypothetical protein